MKRFLLPLLFGVLLQTAAIAQQVEWPFLTLPNETTVGTTANHLAKATGAPSKAKITAITDTAGAIGISTNGGKKGNANIQLAGTALCVFDGATTAGDFVGISSTVAGDCTDAGATCPAGETIGNVFSTNGGAGTYAVLLTVGTCLGGKTGTPGGLDTQVQFNDAGLFGGNAAFTFTKGTGVVALTGPLSLAGGATSNIRAVSGALALGGAEGSGSEVSVGIGDTAPSHTLTIRTATNDSLGIFSDGTNSKSMGHVINRTTQAPFFDFGANLNDWAWGIASGGNFNLRWISNPTNVEATDAVNGSTLLAVAATTGDTTFAGSTIVAGDSPFGSSQTNAAAACETAYGATTLSGASTNTGLNCLPANSVIDAVVYRITVTITTAVSFTVGDGTIAARFCGTQSTMTAGTTGICFAQADQTGTSGPRQVSAAVIKVTPNTAPLAGGAIRLIVYYHTWTAPTS